MERTERTWGDLSPKNVHSPAERQSDSWDQPYFTDALDEAERRWDFPGVLWSWVKDGAGLRVRAHVPCPETWFLAFWEHGLPGKGTHTEISFASAPCGLSEKEQGL